MSKASNSITSADSVCRALRLAASHKIMAPKPAVPSGVLTINVECSEGMDVSDNSNESQRKRELTDEVGFVHPSRSKTAKAGKALEIGLTCLD